MLFREPSLTSLRRDSTRIQNGRFVTGSPSAFPPAFLLLSFSFSLSLPPGTLIYARRYLCQWIYIPIFIIRNIIARAFIALVEMPSPRRLRPASFQLFLSTPFFFFPARSLRGLSRSMRSPGPYISSHLKENIYWTPKSKANETYKVDNDRHLLRISPVSKLNLQIYN